MLRTRVGDLFGIEYPIIQGGMGVFTSAELVAAVSNAGGLAVWEPGSHLQQPSAAIFCSIR